VSACSSASDLTAAAVLRRAAHLDDEDAYEALGLAPDASTEAVRAAYFRLGRVWNPAKLPPHLEIVRSEVERVHAHMTEAHRMLTEADRGRRRRGSGEGAGGA
jgi:preprotein translocase subunit Sec63